MKRVAALACVVLVISGCGGGGHQTTSTSAETTFHATTAKPPSAAMLRDAVRSALDEDHRVSVRVLWTNRVPDAPASTAGPALDVLRSSASTRRRRHIRVRVLSERFRILAISLDSSYETATATVQSVQRSQPSRSNGKPLGKSVRLDERASVVLHRIGKEPRFVVWKVTLAR